MADSLSDSIGAQSLKVYMVFTCFENGEETGGLVIEAKDEKKKRQDGIIGPEDKFWRYIVCHNWTEAMTRYHEMMGFEPYEPLE